MDVQKDLAVQSYCFRGFEDNAVVAQKVIDCGISGIELCRKHVNFDDESTWEAVLDAYKAKDVRVVSIGVAGFAGNPEADEQYMKFAQKAGLKAIAANFNIDSFPENVRVAEQLAEKYDVKLAIHNHGGHHWLGSTQALRHVFNTSSPRIGLMLDTAWALHAHEDPVKMAETFGDRLYGVHLKDFVFDRAGKHEDVVVGTGNLDLKALSAVLKDTGFSGLNILEYEGDVENPVPALVECVERIGKEL